MKKKRLYIFLLLCFAFVAEGQYYSNGAEPFSTNWKQINTSYFQIIFPEAYSEKVQDFASKMDFAYKYVAKSMDNKLRKVSVVIHTQTANSNGMVAWAPRRMELWTVPSQSAFNYSQEWMEQLILHETRHVVQINKMNQGLGKVLKLAFGEQAEVIPIGLYSRMWFLEGDAVTTETALSRSGRGRMPGFEQGLRALTLEKGIQDYDVAMLGSYHHYVPNYYELGYHTVAVNRLFYDEHLFEDKMNDFARYRTFRGFRDNRQHKYYGFAIDWLNEAWQKQDSLNEKSLYETVLPGENDYYSYEFLQQDAGELYALKKSYVQVPEIVALNATGAERSVLKTGWMIEDNFSVRNGCIVYTDYLPDARWEQRSYADVFIADIHTGEKKRLTKKKVYQAPALNKDASRIVTQYVDGNGHFELHILSAYDGTVLRKIPNPKNQFYFSPRWSPGDSALVYVAQEKDKKGLKILNLVSNEEVQLTDGIYGEIANPVWEGDSIYFSASYSGINNIYVCDVKNKEVTRVSSARFGADYATVLNSELYYSNYTSDGYRPVKHIKSKVAGEPLAELKDIGLALGDSLSALETVVDFTKAPENDFEVKNYSRFMHLLNFHSWFPMIPFDATDYNMEIDGQSFRYPYLSLLSQNKLSTSFLTATYNGNPTHDYEKFKLSYTYNGFYPQLGFDVSWGDRDFLVSVPAPSSTGTNGANINVNTLIFIARPSVSLPLSWKKGRYTLGWYNRFFTEYLSRDFASIGYKDSFWSQGFTSTFYRIRQQAVRDLYSPFRQQLTFYNSYEEVYDDEWKVALKGLLYFPGLWPHHSLQMGLAWQQKDLASSDALTTLPRGFENVISDEVIYANGEYVLPLAYPDFSLWSLVNVKRCSLGLYGELAKFSDGTQTNTWSGAGASVFFDVNFMRYEVDFQLGLEAGYATYSDAVESLRPVNVILNMSLY